MKKVCILLLLGALLAFTACGEGEAGVIPGAEGSESGAPAIGGRIYVYNWGDFMDEEVIRLFEAEYGVQVIFDTYGSNEEMYARMVYQGAQFDVLFPSDYMIERLISEGRLRRINWANIPNAVYIDPKFQNLAFDPDNLYSVPYKWGTFGILYNTTMVDQEVYSWNILWDEQFAGQIFMYDIPRDTFGVAQKLLGMSLNSTDLDELNQARDKLIQQGPLVRAFLQDQIKDMMINREGALGVVFSGCAVWSISQNPELNYVVPVEGTQLFFDSMVIPADSRNPEAAELFINFLTRPDIALMNTNFSGFSTTNAGAFAMLPIEKQTCPIYWPSDEVLAVSEVFVDLGEFRAEMERAWIEVMLSVQASR